MTHINAHWPGLPSDLQLEHTIAVNGIRHHVVTAGSGPPVYLLHGFPETWYGWRKQIPVLAEKYTVVAPDLRGYGDSEEPASGYDKRTMANDVVGIMESLGHERVALVRHDSGSRVGTRSAPRTTPSTPSAAPTTSRPSGSRWPPTSERCRSPSAATSARKNPRRRQQRAAGFLASWRG